MSILGKASEAMAAQSGQATSQVIDFVGKSSIVVGGGGAAAEMADTGLTLPDWAAIVAIIGGIFYIVKMTLDIIISHKKLKDD